MAWIFKSLLSFAIRWQVDLSEFLSLNKNTRNYLKTGWVTSLQLEAQWCPWGPVLWGEEVMLVHSLGGRDLEGTMSLMQQEVALVAGGGSGPAWGPTKSNTPNHLAFTKTSSIWMRGENSKTLGLRSSEEFHTCEAAASLYLRHCQTSKAFHRALAVCSWTAIIF